MFFGDAPADLAVARATGIRFVALNPTPELAEAVPDHIDDFRDVALLTVGEVQRLLEVRL